MAALEPTGLRVDLLAFPERTRIRNPRPRFSWIVNDTEPAAYQEAFQIRVARDLARLSRDEGPFLWDSGAPDPGRAWATDGRCLHLPYDGEPLRDDATYHWKVRTWTGPADVGPWSEIQTFHTGALTSTHTTADHPLVTTDVAPVRFVHIAPDHVFVDFGRAAFGTVRLRLDVPAATILEVHLGEVPDGPHGIHRDPGGSRRYRRIPLEVGAGCHEVQLEIPADERNTGPFAVRMPDDLFEVLPFRYCEIVGAAGTLTRDCVHQVVVHAPFDDEAAAFTSSSRVLNDVWDLCRHSIKATTFCGLYVDGDRERIPYEADAYINQLGHYGCDAEFAVARRTHEYLITMPTWPTEWHLDSVLIAWNDYLHTGDDASIAAHYQDLQAKTLTALARDDGLISSADIPDDVLEAIHFAGRPAEEFRSGIRDIIDWPQVERDGFDLRPVNAVVNALHYRAVVAMARIAGALGKAEDVAFYRERAAAVAAAFRARLIDPHTGLVLDGEGSTHSALHANMMALAAGLVPEAQRDAVVAFLRGKGMACSVYGSQFLLEALYAAGAGDDALALLTATGERSWAHMVYDVGTTITLEAWDDRFKPNQDWNHAWGAAPANLIPYGLLGLRPVEPGFGHMEIRPQPGSLRWADGTIPTIRGPVRIAFEQEPGRSFHLHVELPANTTARIALPGRAGDDPTVVVDGRAVAAVPEDRAVVVTGIGSGRHDLLRCATVPRPG